MLCTSTRVRGPQRLAVATHTLLGPISARANDCVGAAVNVCGLNHSDQRSGHLFHLSCWSAAAAGNAAQSIQSFLTFHSDKTLLRKEVRTITKKSFLQMEGEAMEQFCQDIIFGIADDIVMKAE